jgi:threonine/homoserine/homoserine lactone efflux protein
MTSWLARRPLWTVVQRWVLGVVLAGIALRLAADTRR